MQRAAISLCQMNERERFQSAFEIEQGVQQESEHQRTAAPTHPAEKKTDDEDLLHAGPVVLDMQHGPER